MANLSSTGRIVIPEVFLQGGESGFRPRQSSRCSSIEGAVLPLGVRVEKAAVFHTGSSCTSTPRFEGETDAETPPPPPPPPDEELSEGEFDCDIETLQRQTESPRVSFASQEKLPDDLHPDMLGSFSLRSNDKQEQVSQDNGQTAHCCLKRETLSATEVASQYAGSHDGMSQGLASPGVLSPGSLSDALPADVLSQGGHSSDAGIRNAWRRHESVTDAMSHGGQTCDGIIRNVKRTASFFNKAASTEGNGSPSFTGRRQGSVISNDGTKSILRKESFTHDTEAAGGLSTTNPSAAADGNAAFKQAKRNSSLISNDGKGAKRLASVTINATDTVRLPKRSASMIQDSSQGRLHHDGDWRTTQTPGMRRNGSMFTTTGNYVKQTIEKFESTTGTSQMSVCATIDEFSRGCRTHCDEDNEDVCNHTASETGSIPPARREPEHSEEETTPPLPPSPPALLRGGRAESVLHLSSVDANESDDECDEATTDDELKYGRLQKHPSTIVISCHGTHTDIWQYDIDNDNHLSRQPLHKLPSVPNALQRETEEEELLHPIGLALKTMPGQQIFVTASSSIKSQMLDGTCDRMRLARFRKLLSRICHDADFVMMTPQSELDAVWSAVAHYVPKADAALYLGENMFGFATYSLTAFKEYSGADSLLYHVENVPWKEEEGLVVLVEELAETLHQVAQLEWKTEYARDDAVDALGQVTDDVPCTQRTVLLFLDVALKRFLAPTSRLYLDPDANWTAAAAVSSFHDEEVPPPPPPPIA